MKIVAALFLFASCAHARPEVGTKVARDLRFQTFQPDVANLPHEKSVRKGKQTQTKNGGEIPVHLVYDASHDHETEAVVKEVTADSLYKDNTHSANKVRRSLNLKNLENQQIGYNKYDIDADDVNRVLGIEARNVPDKYDYSGSLSNDKNADPVVQVVETDSNKNVVRRIQHYQTFVQPMVFQTEPQDARYSPMFYPLAQRQSNKILDDYFPVVLNNPFNAMWSAFTNIVEYGPDAEICKKNEAKSRRKREVKNDRDDYHEYFIEEFSRSGDGGPKIMKLKVKKGGVAIAGPGGIATAGSGGTAIVGPGGTAYTTPDGTAVVGPGGRVIEIPASFPITRVESRGQDQEYHFPSGGKVVANGPVIYYNFKTHGHGQQPPTVVERLSQPKTTVPVLMYLPDYNAFLVAAESISPDLPSTKRRRPVADLIKLIQSKIIREEIQENTTSPEISEEQPASASPEKETIIPTETPILENLTSTENNKIIHTLNQGNQKPQRPLGALLYRPPQQIFPQYFPNLFNYFQNKEPIKLPFSGFFNPKSQDSRQPIEYYTKTPSSQTYYYNSFPRPINNINTYGDQVQTDITDYVTQVQDMLIKEHADTLDNKNTPVMVASLPIRKDQATSLVLRPVAKAVAGPKGVAVASPIAKAVLRKGEPVDIDFDPDAVAIAGPGGQAHAHPKLIISYSNDTNTE